MAGHSGQERPFHASAEPMTIEQVLGVLTQVIDPDSGKDIVRLDMVKGLRIDGERIAFTVMLKDPGRPFAQQVVPLCETALQRAFGSTVSVAINLDNEMIGLGDDVAIHDSKGKAQAEAKGIQNSIAVASGKGGVGKSTVSVNLAMALVQQGYDVGLLDADIYGPSIPTMFGLRDAKPRVNADRKLLPVEKHGLKLLSMGFMVDPDKAVIWRGPMVSNAIRQFLSQTYWGDLDYLILDLPPGTGDIQLTIVQTVALTGAIVVSTPQEVALADARKGVEMFKNVDVPVLGIVENMAYFIPPDLPDRKYYIFGQGGARRLANQIEVPLIGEVPIEQTVRESGDKGMPIVLAAPESASAQAFQAMAQAAVRQITLRNAAKPATQPIEILYK